MTMQIKIKYLDETQTRISKIEQGDWIDLRAAEDVTIKKDEFKLALSSTLPSFLWIINTTYCRKNKC